MGGIEKVCVIGLDAATFSLIKPWAEEGKLANFKRLMEEGCFGNLPSTIPYLTPPAWTSSVTGQNPGKHNIYDFFKFGTIKIYNFGNWLTRCSMYLNRFFTIKN